jgi:predicted enzyme related to lactoylglutathione lyase
MTNPVGWFEIYVDDMDRAKTFYEAVFGHPLHKIGGEGFDMYAFEQNRTTYGAAGALVKMDGVKAGGNSVLVYFHTPDCAIEAQRAADHGGTIVRPKFSIGEHGFIALATDSEGTMIGIHSCA